MDSKPRKRATALAVWAIGMLVSSCGGGGGGGTGSVDAPHDAGPTPLGPGAMPLVIKNPYGPEGFWWLGQVHTHTTESDGVNTPRELAAAYRAQGYDFLVSTDHRGPAPSFVADDDGFTPDPGGGGPDEIFWIRGAEIGNQDVHLGALGLTSNVPVGDLADTQGAIDAVRARGGIAVINHPQNEDPPQAWDWHEDILPVHGISLVEAFNGKHVEGVILNHIVDAMDLADEFQQVWWIGSDDCHDVNDPSQFNRYAVVVQTDAPAMDETDLLAAADAGRLYIRETAQGPEISGINVTGNMITVTLPDLGPDYQVAWYGRGGKLLRRDTGVDTTARYEAQGPEGYVRVEVTRGADGRRAWSQPLFIANGRNLAIDSDRPAVLDGDPDTFWDAGGASGTIVLDTGSLRALTAVKLEWEDSDPRRFNYYVEVSDTGAFDGEQLRVTRPTYSNRSASTLDFFDAYARYLRVVIFAQSAGAPATARVREAAVYASTPARTDLYVDNVHGDDANSGLAGSPWRTFDHARERVRPRDTLNFLQNAQPYPGLMHLHTEHGGKHAAARVEYRGANGRPAVIDAGGMEYGAAIDDVRWLDWNDFDISGAGSANLIVSGAYNRVQRNRLHDAAGRGVLAAGDFTLAYNLVYANGTDGILVYTEQANVRVYNNVFHGNGVDGLSIQNTGDLVADVRNNAFAGNHRFGLWRATNGTITDSHNCGEGDVVGSWSRLGNVSASPGFVAPDAGDFRLSSGSPCIDAGMDLGYAADFAGEPIRDTTTVPDTGSAGQHSFRTYVDIGAYEAP